MLQEARKHLKYGESEALERKPPRVVKDGMMFLGDTHESLPQGAIIADRYQIIRPLGSGGMASVYLAEDIVLGESRVAIKILRGNHKTKEETVSRFLREVRLTHKINHENVVRTFDFGQDGRTLFYTMEYLDGATLESIIHLESPPIPRVLSFLHQLLRGITAIHAVGIIHRDLKPANIIALDGGRLKITDFGIARGGASSVTQLSGDIVGTMAYVAPETLIGEEPTVAVDYYSLAVIVYQLLTGHLPIDDPIPARLIMRKVEEAPVDPRHHNPDIPEWLAHGLLGLLDPEAKLRMKSLPQFVKNLEQYAPQTESASILTNIAGHTLSLDEVITETPLRERVMRRVTHATTASVLAFSSLIGLAMFLFTRTEFNTQVEFAILDQLFRSRGVQEPDPQVMLIGMDERSYDALSVPITAPWPRDLHTKLLNRLADDDALRVVMDIVFFDTSADVQTDIALAEAINRVPTILGAASGFAQHATLNGSFLLEELVAPIESLASKAAAIGMVGLPARNGRIRNFLVERSELFPDIPPLAVAASGDHSSPGPDSRSLINFYGPARTIPTVSYEMAVSEEHPLPKGTFTNKIVFVGLNLRGRTGPSQREAFVTPFDETTFGTEVHATATSNILKQDWIARLSPGAEASAAVAVAILCALPVLMLSGSMAGLVLGFIALICIVWQYIFFAAGWFIPLGAAVVFGPLAALMIRIISNQRLPMGRRRRLLR